MIPDVPAGSRQPQPSSVPPLRSTGGTAAWSPPSVEELQGWLTNYEIIRIIGQGGMGAVYEGRQISLDRHVAIKLLSPAALNQTDGEDSVERFKNEARSMARMNHPGIVSVYDFGETSNDQFYLVMENVDGTDVAQMILSQGRLPDAHALSITAHVCDALQYAHSHGLIHRDIKPANILLNREGQVKIADFGLAKGIEPGATGLTHSNMTMGTPDFIAPEALIEGMAVDHRSDIYSVGVMLYNMLTGEVPRGAFKMPSVKAGSDPRFDAIIHKAIQSEREDRYQTTQELRRDLDVILTIPMVKLEETGRVSAPGSRSSSRPSSRPVATGPRRTATGPRRTDAGARVATAAHKPAQGMVPAQAAQPTGRTSGRKITRRTKSPAGNASFLYGAIAAAVVVLGGAGWWMMGGGGRKTKPPQVAAAGAASEAPKVSSQQNQPKPPAPPPPNAGNILPPKITELRMVPRHRWFTVLSSRESATGMKGIAWQDGWVDCRADSELLAFTQLSGSHDVQNMALKAVVRPPRPGKEWMWTFREGAHGGYRLVVRSDRLALDFAGPAAGPGQTVRLREGSFPKALATAPQWSLEATIRGDRFFVSLNGQEIFSQDKLKLVEPGSCWLRPGTSGGLTVKELSFKILDDQGRPTSPSTSLASPAKPVAPPALVDTPSSGAGAATALK